MSITGPGCAHCDGGRVTNEFGDVRPCDRCGGFSQFARAVAPEDDWRPLPSVAEVLAHNARTGGERFGPWMWLRAGTTETKGLVRAVMICAALTDDSPNGERVVKVATNEDVMHDDRFRPITRRGAALPWPEVKR